VLAAAALLYAPALNHQFTNWDDDRQITANPDLRDLSWQGIKKIFSTPYVSLYQPLTSLFWAVEYRVFGLNPRVFHAINILLHLANILLVYVLARSLARNAGVALVMAALFAVHPLQVEVVAWASSLSILLFSVFCLGAMIAYVAYARSGRARYLVAALVLFIPALLAKTTAATLPLTLIVIDLYLGRRIGRWTVGEKVPFFVLSGISAYFTMMARSGASHFQDYGLKHSIVQRLCITCYCYLWYVGKLIFPAGLSIFNPFPKPNARLPLPYYLAPLLVLGIAVGIWCAGRYRRLLAFAALFMLTALALVVQIIPVSELMVCDRYAYLPCLGLFFLVGTLGWRIGSRSPAAMKGLLVGLVLVLVALGGSTYRRVGVWRDSITLWNDFLSQRQDNYVAYLDRGMALCERNDRKAALADFDAALQLNPKADKALNNRAVSYAYLGDRAAALRDFDNAILLNPESSYLVNRGILKRDMKDFAGAVQDFDIVIERNPRHAEALCQRADTYRMQGNWGKAIADYEAVLRLNPAHSYAALFLAAALVETGNGERAVAVLNGVVARGNKDAGPAYFLMAQAYQKMGRLDLAQENLRRAKELGYPPPQPQSPNVQRNKQ
jgi:Tfp pilus assembly protein PilF